jgi:hypothetical protein
MKKIFIFSTFLLLSLSWLNAQNEPNSLKKYYSESKKYKFYFLWGYNRSAFAKSDISFKSPNYDFTLSDVRAKDRPTPFTLRNYFKIENLSIPQYNYRIGFFLNKNTGLSLGLDHLKYVVSHQQTVKISGEIKKEISTTYAGTYSEKDIVIVPEFLGFEHTDGLNLLSLDIERLYSIRSFSKNKFRLNGQLGAGAGPVIPRTDARVMGFGLNNRFHRAGWGISTKFGLKLDVLKHFFLQTEFRTGFIKLNDILISNDAPDRAKQNIVFGEWNLVGGWYF